MMHIKNRNHLIDRRANYLETNEETQSSQSVEEAMCFFFTETEIRSNIREFAKLVVESYKIGLIDRVLDFNI